MARMFPIADHDATSLAALVSAGELSAAELVEASISAIEAVNPQLNAVVHRMYDQARAQAKQPLGDGVFAGVPLAVKDFDGFVAGEPFTASTRFLEGFIPDHDSEAIARLRRAGFVMVCKTNLPELAILGTTESVFRGPARNPWNPNHSTGGSSGGSGALVAARAVPLAHGGDGGGSLRIPGSHNGLVGLKASRGRVPLGPDFGEGWGGFVQWGGLTRTVRDTAALLDVMAGPMAGDPYAAPAPERPFREEVGRNPGKLRIAYSTRSIFGKTTHPACVAATEATAKLLADLGHEVVEAFPAIDARALAHAYLAQVGVGTTAEINAFGRWVGRQPRPADFEPGTWFLYQVGQVISGLELQEGRDAIHLATRQMGAFHEQFDLMLGPTTGAPAVRIGELALKPAERVGLAALRAVPVAAAIRAVLAQLAANNFEATPNTQLFNLTGQPAISIPGLPSPEGLPVGVQLSAKYGDDAALLRVAAQLEAAQPWIARRPGVCAG